MGKDEGGEQTLNMLLRKIHIGVRRYMDKSKVKAQLDNVTGMHGCIVGYLKSREEEDVFQRDIEKKFSMRRSTASSILALMEKNNLIERVPVSYDARLKKIVLTDKSQEFISLFQKEEQALDGILANGFTAEEVALLAAMLEHVSANLENANKGL